MIYNASFYNNFRNEYGMQFKGIIGGLIDEYKF